MHNVLFAISAVAAVAGCALLRWSAKREAPAVALFTESPRKPPPPAERSLLAKPLRITIVVERLDQERSEPTTTITLPSAHPAVLRDDHRPTTVTTYLVEDVRVELNDFFESFSTTPHLPPHDLRHCDVVVRGDDDHVGGNTSHVITRAAMPLGVLMTNNPELVEACARALVHPTRRRAFQEQLAEAVRRRTVLGWLEQHELALDRPLPEQGEKPDHRKWPFTFESHEVEGEPRRSQS